MNKIITKKFLLLITTILSVVCIFSFSGCGNTTDDSQSSTSSEQEQTITPPETSKIKTIEDMKTYRMGTLFNSLNKILSEHASNKPENFDYNKVLWTVDHNNNDMITGARALYITENEKIFNIYEYSFTKNIKVSEISSERFNPLGFIVSNYNLPASKEKSAPYKAISDAVIANKNINDVVLSFATISKGVENPDENKQYFTVVIFSKSQTLHSNISTLKSNDVNQMAENIKNGNFENVKDDRIFNYGNIFVDNTSEDKVFNG